VFFDMRGHDGVFYEILDDDQNIVAALRGSAASAGCSKGSNCL
jgi:hypothetical protein